MDVILISLFSIGGKLSVVLLVKFHHTNGVIWSVLPWLSGHSQMSFSHDVFSVAAGSCPVGSFGLSSLRDLSTIVVPSSLASALIGLLVAWPLG